MAVPGIADGWGFRDSDAPLRPCDVPGPRALERLWDDTEQAVFDSAFEPGAGEPRPLYDTWSHRDRSQDQVIFEDEFRAMRGR